MPTTNVGPGSDLELQDIADTMGRSRKVIVVTGAGIGTNCGIPDFRSENGLYSLIQAQYDAALRNPPWEHQDEFDIDDRPKKKRKRWFYEVVRPDGTVVDVIDPDVATTENLAPNLPSSRPASPEHQQQFIDNNTCSSPLSSLGSTPTSLSTRGLYSIAPSTTSTRSQSPIDSTPSQSPTLSSQTSQSGAGSSQSTRAELPNLKGRDLFDSMVWKDAFTTSIFYMFISSLRQNVQDVSKTSKTHQFIRALQEGGRLVRSYTQNIDSLEEREGLSTDLSLGPGNRGRFNIKIQREPRPGLVERDSAQFGGVCVVQLHGNLDGLRCGLCGKRSDWTDERQSTTSGGSAPDCPHCLDYTAKRTGRGRRGLAVGRLRPDIVLYGEEHPSANLIGPLVTHDISLCPDVLLIMGTSLKVHGLKIIVKEFANAVHNKGGMVIFVNNTKPPESTWGDVIDYWVEWDCDAWVTDLKERREDIWLPQGDPRIPKETKSRRESAILNKAKRESTGTAKEAFEVEDMTCGAYQMWKIINLLRKCKGANGKTAPTTLRQMEQKIPAKKNNSKPRKPRTLCPPPARDDKNNSAFLATQIWENLRKIAPSLGELPRETTRNFTTSQANLHIPANFREWNPNPHIPDWVQETEDSAPPLLPVSLREWVGNLQKSAPSLGERPPLSGKITFEELGSSAPPYIKNWAAENPDAFHKIVSSYVSNYTPLPNLITHPPSGLALPLHNPEMAQPHPTGNVSAATSPEVTKPNFHSFQATQSQNIMLLPPSGSAISQSWTPKTINPRKVRPRTVKAKMIKRKTVMSERKVEACDYCREKKVRCVDGAGSTCSKCEKAGMQCKIKGVLRELNGTVRSSSVSMDVSLQEHVLIGNENHTLLALKAPEETNETAGSSIHPKSTERKASHAHGTRASARFPSTTLTIVVGNSAAAQVPSGLSPQDTIVVTTEDTDFSKDLGGRRTLSRQKDMDMTSASLNSPAGQSESSSREYFDAEEILPIDGEK